MDFQEPMEVDVGWSFSVNSLHSMQLRLLVYNHNNLSIKTVANINIIIFLLMCAWRNILPCWVISSTWAAPVILQQKQGKLLTDGNMTRHDTFDHQKSLLAKKPAVRGAPLPDTCYPAMSQPGNRHTQMV